MSRNTSRLRGFDGWLVACGSQRPVPRTDRSWVFCFGQKPSGWNTFGPSSRLSSTPLFRFYSAIRALHCRPKKEASHPDLSFGGQDNSRLGVGTAFFPKAVSRGVLQQLVQISTRSSPPQRLSFMISLPGSLRMLMSSIAVGFHSSGVVKPLQAGVSD